MQNFIAVQSGVHHAISRGSAMQLYVRRTTNRVIAGVVAYGLGTDAIQALRSSHHL